VQSLLDLSTAARIGTARARRLSRVRVTLVADVGRGGHDPADLWEIDGKASGWLLLH